MNVFVTYFYKTQNLFSGFNQWLDVVLLCYFTVGLLPCHQCLCSPATGLQADTRGCWVIERVSSPARHRAIPLKFHHTPARVNRPWDSSGRVHTMHHFCRFLLSFFMPPPSFFHFFLFPSSLTRRLKVGSPSCLHLLHNCQLLTICVSARLSHRPRISGRLPRGCSGMWWHVAFRLCVPCDGLLVRQQQSGIKLLVT